MRSLRLRLTLAMLGMVVLGVLGVSLLINWRTSQEFARFLQASNSSQLIDELEERYEQDGNWSGVGSVLADTDAFEGELDHLTIADENGRVVWAGEYFSRGQVLGQSELGSAIELRSAGAVVGFLLLDGEEFEGRPGEDFSPEVDFINRTDTFVAVAAVGVLAGGFVLSLFVGRTLSRPIRDLTLATRDLSGGELGRQVQVTSSDEIGQLGQAFNEMSAKLSAAENARRQMTADIAHDLRTPLSILGGYAEGLRDGTLQAEPSVLRMMEEEVEHMQHLVEDLRTLSLADAGELRLERQPVEASALLDRVAAGFTTRIQQKGLVLSVEADAGFPLLAVDPRRMTQVLGNLLENAVRHTTKGGIVLAAGQDSRGWFIEVRDSGEGIPPEDLPHVFDRFYRRDSSRQRGESGSTGLGLAIARAIVAAHSDEILVDSQLGEGTTFRVYFGIASLSVD